MTFTELNIAIILVNWNGLQFTKACLDSLMAMPVKGYSVIVVDNASSDGSSSILKTNYPDIVLLENQQNLGFTGGNNRGIKYALDKGADLIILINNDATVSSDFLDKMLLAYKQSPNAGIIQPIICFQHDKDRIWSAGGKYNTLFGISTTKGDRQPITQYFPENKILDWATGCCMMVPAQVFRQVGLLQGSYFAYFEDVDFSIRVRQQGYQILLASDCVIYHEGSASSKKASSEGVLSPVVFYLHARNQLFQLRRHHKFPLSIIAWAYHLLKYTGWIFYFCIRGRSRKLRAVLSGLHDGLTLNHRQENPICP
jgi:GT2 family glycosyltransferase